MQEIILIFFLNFIFAFFYLINQSFCLINFKYRNKMFSLKNHNILITGATGGIGNAIANAMANQGARLVLSATKEDKLQDLLSTLPNKSSGEHMAIACNLADKNEVNNLFDNAEAKIGDIDILICNAGITRDGLILRMKDEDFEDVIDINLRSTFILNRNAIKKMMKRKYGRIINIASVVGVSGNPGQANYVASKAGMIGMSKSLAQEIASRNITINSIAPGFIASPMTDILNEQQKSAILAKIPMGRMGDASEIANAAVFLASKEASYITGHTLHINGGMLMV
jgi:3-oxoacyl-[acyl-carrier protein] reductase